MPFVRYPGPIHSIITWTQLSKSSRSMSFGKMSVNELVGSDLNLRVPHDGNFHVYMANKIQKLNEALNQRPEEERISDIFRNCSFFVNGDTTPSIGEIQRLVVLHGGTFHSYQLLHTTHIICDRFAASKTDKLRKGIGVGDRSYVTVAWLVDSIQSNKRLSEHLYPPLGLEAEANSRMTRYLNPTSIDMEAQGIHGMTDITVVPNVDDVVEMPPARSTEHRSSMNTNDDPNFLKTFFANSRLHFIGTWRNRYTLLLIPNNL